MNEQIRFSPVRLIDQDSVQHGIVSTDEAQRMAREAGLDLVEISPNESPPVCRIMDWGKHKYDQRKKRKQHHGHESLLKEVRLRPKTDVNDRRIKINRAKGFLEHGHKVQFTMLFRGRERSHPDIAVAAFNDIIATLSETAKVERPMRMDGRRMTMVLAPGKR